MYLLHCLSILIVLRLNNSIKKKGMFKMKKKFNIVNLDCANCANKMQEQIAKIKGVNEVNISFVTQKISIDAVDDMFDFVVKEANDVCRKIEKDCYIQF